MERTYHAKAAIRKADRSEALAFAPNARAALLFC
jgi:hypothetical protein